MNFAPKVENSNKFGLQIRPSNSTFKFGLQMENIKIRKKVQCFINFLCLFLSASEKNKYEHPSVQEPNFVGLYLFLSIVIVLIISRKFL